MSGLGEVVEPLTIAEIDRVVDEVAVAPARKRSRSHSFSAICATSTSARSRTHCATAMPGVPVTASSDIAREFREYPRTATAVVNAALRPLVGRYVADAADGLRAIGVEAPFLVMQSNGGCVPAERAEREAHRLLLSGPTAGVAGTIALAARHERRRRDLLRHGRHLPRRVPRAGRRPANHVDTDGPGPSDPGAVRRHRDGGRRWRQHRRGRPCRPAPRRSAERRRRPGPGRVRSWRHRRHAHRRARRRRDPRADAAGRPVAARRRARPSAQSRASRSASTSNRCGRPRGSSRWRPLTACARSAACRSSAGWTRVGTRWWPSAARVRCSPDGCSMSSTWRPCWSHRIRGCSPPRG